MLYLLEFGPSFNIAEFKAMKYPPSFAGKKTSAILVINLNGCHHVKSP